MLLLTLLACLSPAPTPRAVAERTVEVVDLVEGNNAFAMDLYQWSAAHDDGNLFFSPFSITSALGMTRAGASGETAAAMDEVLHIGLPADVFHQNLGALTTDLNGDLNRGYTLRIANALFGQRGLPFAEDFLAITADDYGAPFETLDFAGDPAGARSHINGWVEEQTDGVLPAVIPEGAVTDETRLALANAITFEASWRTKFRRSATDDQPFYTPDGAVTVPMMTEDEVPVRHTGGVTYDVLAMPYEGDEVSLVVVLPYETDGLAAVEASLDLAALGEMIDGATETEETVTLPRFTLRHTLRLTQALTDLGMGIAFDEARADFTAMGPDDLYMQEALHQAWVQVDEEGTKAAASTIVLMAGKGAEPYFRADHPFLFLIRDDLTGSVLFMGRVVDPSVEG